MNILVIGGGGREHAIIKKLRENPGVETIWALPGNGGIASDAVCVNIRATDIEGIASFAAGHPVDYAVVAPDDPLAAGCVDVLEAAGISCFGPRKNAAVIESSKVFAKNLMKKYGIPTAAYEVFDEAEKALQYLETAPMPAVIKADGKTHPAELQTVREFMRRNPTRGRAPEPAPQPEPAMQQAEEGAPVEEVPQAEAPQAEMAPQNEETT